MLKWQADFLLATHTILECADRICLNAGTCLNFGALTSNGGNDEHCVCADDFFGANCEFNDDDLVINGLSYGKLSISDDDNRSRRSSLVGYAELQENSSEDSFEMKPDYGTQVETWNVSSEFLTRLSSQFKSHESFEMGYVASEFE